MPTNPYIILADGSFPVHELPLSKLKTASKIICCDGAASKLLHFGLEPDHIVGDLDSLPAELKERYSDRLVSSADQETNDQTKAVLFCKQLGADAITILGATGLREDHTLGNIALLADYSDLIPEIEMMTDYGIFTAVSESCTLPSYKGQQISVFALDRGAELSVENLKYPIYQRCLTSWWQGTLNEATGDSFSLSFSSGKWIIFRCY